METSEPAIAGASAAAEGSLGALLYADQTRARTPESDWAALVRAIADRDQSALRALYQRAHRIVYIYVLRIAGNAETAEELTLDVFHDIWRKASVYDPGAGTVVAWIMNQARSRAIDRLRYEQRKKRRGAHEPLEETATVDAGERIEFTHASRRLRDALSVLSSPERLVIETAFFSDMSYSEVAAHLGQPVGTVKTRIRSGLAKLRETLGEAHKP